jgi:hypothetical protein
MIYLLLSSVTTNRANDIRCVAVQFLLLCIQFKLMDILLADVRLTNVAVGVLTARSCDKLK